MARILAGEVARSSVSSSDTSCPSGKSEFSLQQEAHTQSLHSGLADSSIHVLEGIAGIETPDFRWWLKDERVRTSKVAQPATLLHV